MEQLLELIRVAVAAEADAEARAAGATACRTLLAHLEPAAPPAAASAPPPLPIAELAAAIRGIPMEQLLDVAITRLKAALPAGTTPPEVRKFQFPILTVPQRGGHR